MANYTGANCPVCKKRFAQTDDVVVCPDCGTPHHRECWHQNGGCANADKHGTDFVFEIPKVNPRPAGYNPQNPTGDLKDSGICPFCGSENPEGAIFCIRCGKDMSGKTTQNSYINMGDNTGHFTEGYDFSVYGGLSPEDTIDDIKAKDMANYIGKSSGYYLYHFKNMDRRGKKTAFSFSAFFITPIYMFYRKMWGWGIIATVVNALLSLPSMVLNTLSIFNEQGFYAIVDKYGADKINLVLMVLSILSMVYSAFFGLFSIWLYRKHVVKQIGKIKLKNLPLQEEAVTLQKKGGVSYLVMVILLVLLVASYVLSFISSMY